MDLYEGHLQLTQICNNNPKTKKKIIITILNMLESDLSPFKSPKYSRKSDLNVEVILKSSFLVARMNKGSL